MLRSVLVCLGVVAAVLVGGSYGGAFHPAGDSLAVIRYPLVGVVMLCAFGFWRAPLAKAVVLLGLALLGERLWMGQADTPVEQSDVMIYQKNMRYTDYDALELAQDIWASGARVVTLQEVSRAHYDFLEIMKDTHPFQLVCEGTAVGAVAVLAADQSVANACSEPAGIAVMDVAIRDLQQRMRIVSLHLHWPWPYGQAAGLDAALAGLDMTELNMFDPPVVTVLGGDFNMVPWGHTLRRVEDAFAVKRIGHVERTFLLSSWPLAIDHVMAGPDAAGQIEVRPRLGSDHFGVLGRVVADSPSGP